MADKLVSLAEAAALVEDGMTVALGGMSTQFHPMAFVRELARRRVRDLTVVSMVCGIDVDLLCAAGCIKTAVIGLCSFEGFGLAPSFRSQAQSGRIRVEEYSENILLCAFQAAARDLPFMPTKAGIGTGIEGLHPDTLVRINSPWGEVLACKALQPDMSVIHAHEVDAKGNVRVLPKPVWLDVDIAQAGKKLVVTAERVVPHETFRADPFKTTFSAFQVDAVVHAPKGAHPCGMLPEYGHDANFYIAYQQAAAAGELDKFLETKVLVPEKEYLKLW
jgi:glutaconate CoA-transferase subunit A